MATVNLTAGDDIYADQPGVETVDGLAGFDTLTYTASRNNLTFARTLPDGFLSLGISGAEATQFANFERVQFTDGSFAKNAAGQWYLESSTLAAVGSVAVSSITLSEGNSGTSTATVTVTRTGGTAAFTLPYATADGGAKAGSDYVASSGTLAFAANEMSKTISITLTGDTATETDEAFYVRLGNPSAGTLSPSKGTIDVFLIAGQSNAQGYGDALLSPAVDTERVLQFKNGQISSAKDPVGPANTGSAWPAFGNEYVAETGRKILFASAAVGGSSQTATQPVNNWTTNATLFADSVKLAKDAITAATAQGYTPVFRGILWNQGESDARAINNGAITAATYETALKDMITRYRGEFGASTPFYIYRSGIIVGESDVGYAQVRAVQDKLALADPLTSMVFTEAINYPTRGLLIDNAHYTQAGYDEMGKTSAKASIRNQIDSTPALSATSIATIRITDDDNVAPVLTAVNGTFTSGSVTPATKLFGYSDTNSDEADAFRFKDLTTGNGAFTVNGTLQAANTAVEVTAQNVASVNFVAASGGDVVQVSAFDGTAWSEWVTVSINGGTLSSGVISLTSGNDTYNDVAGVEKVDGLEGTDTVVFSGLRSQLTNATNTADGFLSLFLGGSESMQIKNIERVQFSDETFVKDASGGWSVVANPPPVNSGSSLTAKNDSLFDTEGVQRIDGLGGTDTLLFASTGSGFSTSTLANGDTSVKLSGTEVVQISNFERLQFTDVTYVKNASGAWVESSRLAQPLTYTPLTALADNYTNASGQERIDGLAGDDTVVMNMSAANLGASNTDDGFLRIYLNGASEIDIRNIEHVWFTDRGFANDGSGNWSIEY